MTTLGKYELHEQLGKGGFGTVYRATDTTLGREVALKILHPQLMVDEEFISRFKREARTLAALDNHHIVTIYEIGEEDGRIFIAMRYLPGGSLKQRIQVNGPIPFDQALSILQQVCNGLTEAHAKGMVHRDIKPENILFDAHGEAVVTDFGLVKAASGSGTSTSGVMIGTPAYIAPEIWSGKPASPATDVYALACVFYEMLTGKVLHQGESTPEVMKKHFDPLVLPETWPTGVPTGINLVMETALAKDPQERYQQAVEFPAALGRLVAQSVEPTTDVQPRLVVTRQAEPVTVNPPAEKPVTQEPRKGARWVLPAVLAGITLVVLAIGFSTNWFTLAAAPTAVPTVQPILATETIELGPTNTSMPVKQPTNTSVPPTPTKSLGIGSQMTGKDGMVMVYVPSGTFTMGSDDGFEEEKPTHQVTLEAFWIDQTEVTNAMYKKCVDQEMCDPPSDGAYFYNSDYTNHPVTYVNWTQADQYCTWAGRQLPTEAQWEYAARGTDGRTYPWGNDAPTCERANFSGCIGTTWEVGGHIEGQSPFGVYDMAGNVWEWVADWFDGNYYSSNASWSNPTGPASGEYKVLRGGSWYFNVDIIRSAYRFRVNPSLTYFDGGFRCSLPLE